MSRLLAVAIGVGVGAALMPATLAVAAARRARPDADPSGAFTAFIKIPINATLGTQHVRAKGLTSGEVARQRFKVT